MHDASLFEAQGIPTIVLATDPFESTVEATADLLGFPTLRVVYAPHPVSRLDDDGFAALAVSLADEIAEKLAEQI